MHILGWSRTIWDLDPENEDNNGIQNEGMNELTMHKYIILLNCDCLIINLFSGMRNSQV